MTTSHYPSPLPELVALHHERCSVLVDVAGGVPTIVHWGAPFGDLDATHDGVASLIETPLPHGGLDVIAPLALVPEHAAGYLGRPGIEGHRADGSGWAPRFVRTSCEASRDRVTVHGRDEAAALSIVTTIELTAAGTVRARAELTNDGTGDYALDALRCTLPMPSDVAEALTFSGRWCNEFRLNRQPWIDGAITLDNRSGRTGHSRVPAAMVGTRGFGEDRGEVWAVHLEWSGNSSIVLDVLPDARRTVQAGELLLSGELNLAPGASYATPWLSAAYSPEGTNGISASFHAFLRSRPGHPTTPRPVTLNTWEAVYFDHDLATLKRLADRGAEVGAERFVLDDGWFRGRRNDFAGLGDWTVDPDVWPNGLRPIIEHVTGLGMQFGLWVEPEMVNPDSDLYRAHPDWVLEDAAYPHVFGRHQLVLDLGRDDVRAYLREHIDALLRDNDITYLKWDMNRELVHGSHGARAGVHAQTLGIYRLLDDLRALHPGVEIESCASGGGRIDFAILERTARVWTSDCQDPLERQLIQRGYSYLFPPELMGAHVAAPTSHTTHRTHTLEFRAGTAFFGHFGIEWNLLDTSDEDRKTLTGIVEAHKRFRPLLHGGTVRRLDHPNPAVLAHAVVAPDRREALVGIVQMASPASHLVERVRVSGLDPLCTYDVRVLPLGRAARGPARRQSAWPETGARVLGAQLASIGIQPPIIDPESLIVVHLTALG